ncbi:glycosyltransferase family 4 protein [Sulfurimonas sp. HSL3-7]|uniref:glycosyltransferase family 4 protein n=1 Tax=Sulfonitrofixus jiaomeiensis TaxID=3131938 RepID=UPI0031F81197
MKILIVNTSDLQGGAAKAAYRLHRALLDAKINSRMLVQNKISDDTTVFGSKTKRQRLINKVRRVLDQFPIRFYRHRTKTLFTPAWLPFSNVVDHINKINPDLVHLHWIGFGMIRIEELARIKAPIVWSLHDNWAFTGGCHVKWECEKYKEHCGACPRLGSNSENDLSRYVFTRKEKTFSRMPHMTIVALSRWLESCAKESTLFKDKRVTNLPNPIDTKTFMPSDRAQAREHWNLPKDKKLVLFGAMAPAGDINKGFIELKQALHNLSANNIELVIFGNSEPQHTPEFDFRAHYIGHLDDDVALSTLYSACDVMVVPSLQENLSNVIMESLACATPVVAFDVGGNSDMIEHRKNGYLAIPLDTDDLTHGIEWVLNTPDYDELSKNAEAKIAKEFDSVVVAQKYIALYKESLNER